MAEQTQDAGFSPIPKVEFSPRTGQPIGNIDLTDDSNSQAMSGSMSVKTGSDNTIKTTTPKKGMFVINRLNKLYNDPIYKNADVPLKQYYKEKAYDKWVVPYYKHNNMEPPTKEQFLTGQYTPKMGKAGYYQGIVDKAPGIGYASLKETSKIVGGLSGLMSYVGAGIDWISGSDTSEKEGGLSKEGVKDKNLEQHFKDLQSYFKGKEDYYDKQLEASNDGHAPTWRENPEQKLAQLTTQGIFFEATGAAKAAKLLQVVNPRTTMIASRVVKSAWNTAVGFGLWSASQGDKPKDIATSAATGAVLGPVGQVAREFPGLYHLDQFHDMLQVMSKYGGPEASKVIINDAVNKASEGHGKDIIDGHYEEEPMSQGELQVKVQDLLKSVQTTEAKAKFKSSLTGESQVASSAIALRLHGMAVDRYGKSFDKLPWIQQRGIINKFLSQDVLAAQIRANGDAPNAEVLHTFIKEQQENLAKAAPISVEVNKNVDNFLKQNGAQPSAVKLKATLPRHNTTIDSPVRDVHARISFLNNQLRSETDANAKKEISQAIKEEKGLLAQIKTKQATRSKPGAALVNDTVAFKGDDFIIRPAGEQDPGLFRSWKDDKFAGQLHQQITKESPAGAMDRKAQAIMTSFQAGNMLEMFAQDRFQDTVVLQHSKYGPIGGANYSIIEDRGGKLGKTLMLNWIALRPNVVAKVYDTPGAGQTLFLSVLEKARAANAGVELHSAPSAENFYRKMGMTGDENGNFKLDSDAVKEVLKNKGLLMGLLGAGIGTYAATQEQKYDDITALPQEKK